MKQKLVFVADKWGPYFGGINTFNFEMCQSIAKFATSFEVVCVVSSQPSKEEEKETQAIGLTLVWVPETEIDTTKQPVARDEIVTRRARKVIDELRKRSLFPPSHWIGHDTVSGELAIKLKEVSKLGTVIIFHHMNYRAYESRKKTTEPIHLKQKNTLSEDEIKDFLQRSILNKADITVAIGPKLYNSAKEIVQSTSKKPVFQLIPGLSEITYNKVENIRFSGIVFGRYSERIDPIKQVKLAVASFSAVVDNPDEVLSVVGVDTPQDAINITDIAKDNAKLRFPVNTYPYLTNRKELLAFVARHSACMMLSSHEGFGLVGWEAVACGVPLVISKNTGLYEFLQLELSDAAKEWIYPVDIESTFGPAESPYTANDIAAVKNSLLKIKANVSLAKEKANLLHQHLKQYTWENAVKIFCRILRDNDKLIYSQYGELTPEINSEPKDSRITLPLEDQIDPPKSTVEKIHLGILKTVFPNQEIDIVASSDKRGKDGILYHCYKVKYLNFFITHLFIHESAVLKKTFEHLLSQPWFDLKQLVILTKRVKAKNENEAFRANSIKRVIKGFPKLELAHDNVYFIDEYLWNNRLAHLKAGAAVREPKHYINQFLYSEDNSNEAPVLTNEFFTGHFNSRLDEAEEMHAPVSAIFGIAGAGKTTLCDYIAHMVSEEKFKLPIYISSKKLLGALDKYEGTISNVFELFQQYKEVTNEYKDFGSFEQSSFELNVSCGNIVVIIDGLDEIESVLKDKFNLDEFLSSIIELNNLFSNCNIFLTSRDFHIDKYRGRPEIKLFRLKGFTDTLINDYFSKRFKESIILQARAKQILNELPVLDEDYIVPLTLDLISRMVETETETDLKEKEKELYEEVTFFKPDYVLDNLIYNILHREVQKQSLTISINNLIDLLKMIEIDYHGSMPKNDFDDFIRLCIADNNADYKGDIFTPFYVNPLIFPSHKTIQIRYDSVSTLIKARFIQEVLLVGAGYERIDHLLAGFYDGKGTVLDELISFNEYPDNIIVNFRFLIGDIRFRAEEGISDVKAIKSQKHSPSDLVKLESRVDMLKKANSGSLYFVNKLFTKLLKPQRTELIFDLYGGLLHSVFIYGDFYPLDFRKVCFTDSEFHNYNNICNSLFSLEEVCFERCTFTEISDRSSYPFFKKNFFECLTPTSFRDHFKWCEGSRLDIMANIKDDLVKFFNKFKYNSPVYTPKSFDLLQKQYKSKLSVNNFISALIDQDIIIANGRLYSVNPLYIEQIESLKHDPIAPQLFQRVIFAMMDKYFPKFAAPH